MTVRATNVRVRFRADLRLSDFPTSATHETHETPFSNGEKRKDDSPRLADALLRVDEIAFGNLDTFEGNDVVRSSDPLRSTHAEGDAEAWDAKNPKPLENDDASDLHPRGFRADANRTRRRSRAV